jgi:hypothetical protein
MSQLVSNGVGRGSRSTWLQPLPREWLLIPGALMSRYPWRAAMLSTIAWEVQAKESSRATALYLEPEAPEVAHVDAASVVFWCKTVSAPPHPAQTDR